MSFYKGFLKQNIILNAVLVLQKWLDRECEKNSRNIQGVLIKAA